MIDLEKLLRVPGVEVEMGFDISPDGERVAFSWNPQGRWEIYEISLQAASLSAASTGKSQPGDSTRSLRLISRGPGGKFHPRYSPDGKHLAYSVDLDGSEAFHLVVHDFISGEQRDLTPGGNCILQADFAWSPDSRNIAFIADRSGQFDVYVISAGGGNARFVFDAGYPAWKVRWSPDGAWLAVTVEAGGIDYGTSIIPAMEPGEICRITDESGPIDAGQVCWSPDSTRLAFTSDVHGFNNVGIYHLGTGSIFWLTAGEGDKQYPAWSPDGKRLVYVLNRSTLSWLVVQELEGSQQTFQVEPGVHYVPRFTPSGSHVIFVFDNPSHPDDLWSLSLADGKFNQLTHSLPAELSRVRFPIPQEIAYPGMDGTPIPALLFKPKARIPGPAVILVHGGPDWFFEMTWYPLMAHMASRGWVVLVPNYRGSTGYGRSWQEASRFDYGGVDNDDVAAGALYLAQNNLADPHRIGITGRSHGGYLTMTCLTKYPDLWAAGSAVVPFINWFTNHESVRPDLQHWVIENFGDPLEDHDFWVERSPFYFLDRVSAPVQLIAGRLDQRCPVSDSIEAHSVLQGLGKPVELIIYDDEGHAFLNMKNVLDSEQRRVDFLVKYLEK